MRRAFVATAMLTVSATVFAAPLSAVQRDAMREALTEDLKDPSSAQLRRIELVDGRQAAKPGEGIYCGEMNAKNSYGAYTGFSPFIAAIVGDKSLAIKVAHDEDSSMVVREICRKSKAGEIG